MSLEAQQLGWVGTVRAGLKGLVYHVASVSTLCRLILYQPLSLQPILIYSRLLEPQFHRVLPDPLALLSGTINRVQFSQLGFLFPLVLNLNTSARGKTKTKQHKPQ